MNIRLRMITSGGGHRHGIDIIIVKIIGFILPGGFIVFIKFKNN